MGTFHQFCQSYLPATRPYFRFQTIRVNINRDFYQIWYVNDIIIDLFGIAYRQSSSIFDRVICPPRDSGGALSFHVFINFISSEWTLLQ